MSEVDENFDTYRLFCRFRPLSKGACMSRSLPRSHRDFLTRTTSRDVCLPHPTCLTKKSERFNPPQLTSINWLAI